MSDKQKVMLLSLALGIWFLMERDRYDKQGLKLSKQEQEKIASSVATDSLMQSKVGV